MKIVNLIIILCFSFLNIQEVVKEFHELKTKEVELLFIDKYKQINNPSILAYVHAIEMKQAEYKINPLAKLKIFNTSKKKINQLIDKNPNNIHLRYIRLMLQEKTPGILGYTDFIEEDKSFIKEKLNTVDISDFLDTFIHKNTSL